MSPASVVSFSLFAGDLMEVSDAILKLSRPEEARRRRIWENQLNLNSIAALATRINGSFSGYCCRTIVFPRIPPTNFGFVHFGGGRTRRRELRNRLFPCWS
ncbi:hypothetical protein Q8A73_004138 [Channa argus]|nr:hypothetical protein Q8A73_004138 [Channa argus]